MVGLRHPSITTRLTRNRKARAKLDAPAAGENRSSGRQHSAVLFRTSWQDLCAGYVDRQVQTAPRQSLSLVKRAAQGGLFGRVTSIEGDHNGQCGYAST
jgi:hypothetical protein